MHFGSGISWGTKGDTKPAADRGLVTTGKNKNQVEPVVSNGNAIHVLGTRPPKLEAKIDEKTAEDDYCGLFRTTVLLLWTLSNDILAAVVLFGTGDYLAFVPFSSPTHGVPLHRASSYVIVPSFAGEETCRHCWVDEKGFQS